MKKKILWVVSLLFGLMFINAGLNKFFNYMPMPEHMPDEMVKLMGAFGQIGWLMPLVAVAEIAGGILVIPTKTRALGAIIILPVMAGILLTHLINQPTGLPMALVLLTIQMWIIIENRERYVHLIK